MSPIGPISAPRIILPISFNNSWFNRITCPARSRTFPKVRRVHAIIVAAICILASPAAAFASWDDFAPITQTITVSGPQGPWLYSATGLNSNLQYGVHDQHPPAIITGSSGFSFQPGSFFTLHCLRGSVTLSKDARYVAPDAYGGTGEPVNSGTGSSRTRFPSYYFDHADYPAGLGALTGAFADSSGAIIGKPFLVGNFRSVEVPPAATQLQLGINDDLFADNSGSFIVTVGQYSSQPIPPELAGEWRNPNGDFLFLRADGFAVSVANEIGSQCLAVYDPGNLTLILAPRPNPQDMPANAREAPNLIFHYNPKALTISLNGQPPQSPPFKRFKDTVPEYMANAPLPN